MKIINRIFQALAIICSVGALVLFFTEFATVTFNGEAVKFVGAALAFGAKTEIAGQTYDMNVSLEILFPFILTAISALIGVFAFKKKGLRYTAPFIGAIAGIYMLVMALGWPNDWVNTLPLPDNGEVTSIVYGSSVLYCAIALLAFTVFSAAYLLLDDYLEVKASKGAKRTIFKRIAAFFKDYKSETKKIVWPGIKDVLKNTAIVLLMCLIIGAFIWLLDMGIGKLFEAIRG